MFWILIGVLEEDDDENWVIGVVNRVVCADFKVLEEVIGVVDQVIYAIFNIIKRWSLKAKGSYSSFVLYSQEYQDDRSHHFSLYFNSNFYEFAFSDVFS